MSSISNLSLTVKKLMILDNQTFYYYTLRSCKTEEVCLSEESLKELVKPFEITQEEVKVLISDKDTPTKGKELGKETEFLEKINALPLEQLKKLCFDFVFIVKGTEKPDFFQSNRLTLIKALKGTVPIIDSVSRQWLMILTRRASKGLVPATQHMKKGMVSFSAQLDEKELRRFFKDLF